MRIMVLGTTESAEDLGMQLAETRDLVPIRVGSGETAATLKQQLESVASMGGVLLRGGPETVKQATELDSLLDGLGISLDLVIEIDTSLENPATRPTRLATDKPLLSQYYREQGLLRRIRGEGDNGARLAAAVRIADDLARAQRREGADPFTAALQAMAKETPAIKRTDTEVPDGKRDERRVEPMAKPAPAAASAPGAGGGWKRTADRKGRLRRQPVMKKGGRKPRN